MISELIALVPPPTATPPGTDWTVAERNLGVRLPLDYRELMDIYGPGYFNDFLYVLHPSTNPDRDMLTQREVLRDVVRDLDEILSSPFRPDSLLPWAITINGDVCYWLADGDTPEQWPIVITDNSPEYEMYQGNAVRCLFELLTGRWICSQFPTEGLFGQPPFFTSDVEAPQG